MGKGEKKARFRLNVFDAVVLLVVLVVGAYFVWNALKPDESATVVTNERTVHYTILLQNCKAGTGAQVAEGDKLEDTLKNFSLGAVRSSATSQARTLVVDNLTGQKVMADIPGSEDVRLEVEASATESDSQLIVGGGFEIRVGTRIYVRGPGYLGSGYIVAIEREDDK